MSTGVICVDTTKESAIKLAGLLDVPHTILPHGIPTDSPYVTTINWGVARANCLHVFNNKVAIKRSRNKLHTFELLKDHIRLPVLTEDRTIAREWVSEGRSVVMRDRVLGSRSQGIVITNNIAVFDESPAKFYTRFIKNCVEYRVNCWQGEILSVYRKVPSNNSFLFKIDMNYVASPELVNMAEQCFRHIGLDMYGMDTLKAPSGKEFFLELNSGPVLFDITAHRFAKKIKEALNG